MRLIVFVREYSMGDKQSRIHEIGNKLHEEFKKTVAVQPSMSKRGKKLSESEIKLTSEVALNKFYETAYQERLRYNLGIIGRARVAFDLQQRLLKDGYPAPLVKQVLFALLASVFVGQKR